MEKGKYYLTKLQEHDYQFELQQCIEKACQFCIDIAASAKGKESADKVNHPLMMLGKIQSGKTRAFTGLMALAFDNKFDMVFILTKNSKALVKQTYRRMKYEFRDSINANEVEVFDIMKAIGGLTNYELDKKIVVVAKKETSNLDRISQFISDYTIQQRKNCLIIDDEADTTGIGFNKVKGSIDEFDLRTIASKLNEIRGSLDGCVFLQVTATPYALYLQPEFESEEIRPVKPLQTFSVPSGYGYIGGEYYFVDSKEEGHPGQFIYQPVSDDEHSLISDQKRKGKKSKINDRRSFKEEDIIAHRDRLEVFKRGLMNFIVGGSVLRLTKNNSHYSYIIHTATQKSSHVRLESIAREFFKQIREKDELTSLVISEMIIDAYKDIQRSVEAFDYIMPSIIEVEKEFYRAVEEEHISITVVNSDKDIDAILDEDTGELRLRSPFSILVGGQVLDRGVTIPNLIGFYYGRNPKTMQQDTVLQHSRMFGYRSKELISTTRFYTTRRIYENMIRITEMDMALREDIERGNFSEGIYFIEKYTSNSIGVNGQKIRDEIIPCSPAKVALSNIVMLKPHSRLLPVGFQPVAKTYAIKISKDIKKLVSNLINDETKDAVMVSIDDIQPIIKLVYSALKADDDAARFVDVEKFLTTIRYLTRNDRKLHLIVRYNREAKKYKKNGITYQDAPDTPKDELLVAQIAALNHPSLILLHQDGSAEGWNGSEFFWPVLVTQQNVKKTIFAMEDSGGKVRKNR